MAISEEGEISPYAALIKYDGMVRDRRWLYESDRGKPYTQDAVRKMLEGVLKSVGVKPSEYNTHSFRIGKATDMWKQGFTDVQIHQATNTALWLVDILPTSFCLVLRLHGNSFRQFWLDKHWLGGQENLAPKT